MLTFASKATSRSNAPDNIQKCNDIRDEVNMKRDDSKWVDQIIKIRKMADEVQANSYRNSTFAEVLHALGTCMLNETYKPELEAEHKSLKETLIQKIIIEEKALETLNTEYLKAQHSNKLKIELDLIETKKKDQLKLLAYLGKIDHLLSQPQNLIQSIYGTEYEFSKKDVMYDCKVTAFLNLPLVLQPTYLEMFLHKNQKHLKKGIEEKETKQDGFEEIIRQKILAEIEAKQKAEAEEKLKQVRATPPASPANTLIPATTPISTPISTPTNLQVQIPTEQSASIIVTPVTQSNSTQQITAAMQPINQPEQKVSIIDSIDPEKTKNTRTTLLDKHKFHGGVRRRLNKQLIDLNTSDEKKIEEYIQKSLARSSAI